MNKLFKLVFGLFILAHSVLAAGLPTEDHVIKLIQEAKTNGKEKVILKFREKSNHVFAITGRTKNLY